MLNHIVNSMPVDDRLFQEYFGKYWPCYNSTALLYVCPSPDLVLLSAGPQPSDLQRGPVLDNPTTNHT